MGQFNIPTVDSIGYTSYHETNELNAFQGVDSEELQVLHSPRGYYIGTLKYDRNLSTYLPYSRNSSYFDKRERAEAHLIVNESIHMTV